MAFDYIIDCSGERHALHFSDDGTISAAEHEPELEAALVELGAEKPECLEGIELFEDSPEILIESLVDLYDQQKGESWSNQKIQWGTRYHYYDWIHQEQVSALLCADAIEHVASKTELSPASRDIINNVIDLARVFGSMQTPKYPPEYQTLKHELGHAGYKASRSYGGFLNRGKKTQAAVARAASNLAKALSGRGRLAPGSVVLNQTQIAAAALEWPSVKKLGLSAADRTALKNALYNREKQWQAAQLIRGLTHLLQDKPWPSI
jgi:hypothetical protein